MDEFVRKPYRSNEIYECLSRQLGVEYICSTPFEPTVETVALTPKILSEMPKELLCDLKNALKSLDSERIDLTIQQFASYDRKLQKTFAHLAENFDYPSILKALRTD